MDDSGGFYHKGGEENGTKKTSSLDDLKNGEKSFYHGSNGKKDSKSLDNGLGKKSSLTGSGLKAAGNTNPVIKAALKVSKHKKGLGIGGSAVVGLLLIIVVGIGGIITHEINVIEEDLLNYEGKAMEYMEYRAARSLLEDITCRKLEGSAAEAQGCAAANSEEGDNSEADKLAEDSKLPMTEELDDFSFSDSPELIDSLQNQGISIAENANGGFSHFYNTDTGSPITASDLDDPAVAARFQAAIPDWEVSQENVFRSLMERDVGADFGGLASDTTNTDQQVVDEVTGETNDSTDPAIDAQNVEAEVGVKETGKQTTDKETGKQTGDSAAKAAKEDAETLADDGESSGILDGLFSGVSNALHFNFKVIAGFGNEDLADSLGHGALINTAIVMFCDLKNAVSKASASRIPEIIGLLVRHTTTLVSVADESKVPGKLSGKQISTFTGLFNGDPKANPNSKNPSEREAALPFDRSAAWQRISNNASAINNNPNDVSSYTPEIATASLPVENAGTKLVNEINGFLGGGVNFVCKVDNGVVGDIISLGLGAAQAVAGSFSVGLSQALITAGIGGAFAFIHYVLLPKVEEYFTPILLYGLEDSVQWMNNADAGGNLAFNMFSERLGGKPLTNNQAVALAAEGTKTEQIAQAQKPLYDRLFAFSDPESLVSKIIVDLPMSKVGMMYSAANAIIKSPIMLITNFGDLIGGARAYALTPTNPGQPYGITQYGFTPSEINKYNPIVNEEFLYNTKIRYGSISENLISLLGNPNNYPNSTNDPSQVDVFHCFTQGIEATAAEDKANSICGTMGNFDYTNLTPVPISNTQVANSFCDQLASTDWTFTDPGCFGTIYSEIAPYDIMSHFRQYILDDEVAGFYTSLDNIQ